MTGTIETVDVSATPADRRQNLADVLARPGTRVVMLAGSRDPNAKVTFVLLDDYGPAFAVKVPTTDRAADVVRREGQLLEALSGMALGPLGRTLPRSVGYLFAGGLPALVTTALPGVPMTVGYHAWRHTSRRRAVECDFAAAGAWLADLQTRTTKGRAQIGLLAESLDLISARFPDYPGLATLREGLAEPAAILAEYTTPRTVVHGDYWFGNLLVDHGRVVGVLDWESGAGMGEPLRDVARFAVSYALYLDRHVRHGRRVPGHPGLRADAWGAGLVYEMTGRGWFGGIVQEYLGAALDRLGVADRLWPEVLLCGVAEVAATADHPEFALLHLDLLLRMIVAEHGRDRSPIAEVAG